MKKETKLEEAKRIADAWQTLYYSDVMGAKESEKIFAKIKTRYGKILNIN